MDLEHFQQLLLDERKQYVDQVDMIRETGIGDLSHGDQNQEDSTVDNHPADLGTEMFEREKDLGLRSNAIRRLRDIDTALERMTSGEYGTCMECGNPIPEERLEVFPSALTCIECQTIKEAPADRFHRPIEEQVLNPPWGRSFRDGTGDPGYDGEDAWQEVASYGTSESPSDVPGAVKFTDMYNSDEDVYTVVDHMDALVDEDGEPLQRDDRDHAHQTDWNQDTDETLYGPQEMDGEYAWEVGIQFHGVMPENQFRRGQFPRGRMPR
ncbi:MAG TPA: TraR/DksA C4-type zinc finger protein [Symbiobacteriaceae bacterium]|nr:TraR/DksA C4-type zinc finger protein [Symbiobacteriaceae bacterium]